jgi:hypothetical protein
MDYILLRMKLNKILRNATVSVALGGVDATPAVVVQALLEH